MTEYRRTQPGNWPERLYRAVLRLYPADFRDEFGDAMSEFFHDRLIKARQTDRRGDVARVWIRALRDVARNALPTRLDSVRRSVRALRQRRATAAHLPSIHASRRKDWMLTSIMQDMRYAWRSMLHQPAFTLVILVTLALGIGANAAIFSVVNGVMLRPLPYVNADRIVQVNHEPPNSTVSEPEFADYKRELRAFDAIAAFVSTTANISGGDGEPERLNVLRVSDGFFRILGVSALQGRTFLPDEDTPKRPRVIVLSHGVWQQRYGGDPKLVGKDITINGRPYAVIGIMPRNFGYPSPEVAAWFPMRLNFDSLWTRNNHYLTMIGKLAPSATIPGARVEMNTMTRRFAKDFPQYYSTPLNANIQSVSDTLLGKTRPYLYALLGTVGFVLLIACVNVANLLLARGESRRKELALRSALGASRVRIVRQVLTESALFALFGGAAGVALAWLGVRALVSFAPASIPRLDEVRVDPTVLIFASIVTIVTGLLFGIIPALRGARDDSAETLKAAGKVSGQARGLRRARAILVVCEVALAVVTLTGAGLMVRSLRNLQAIDLGIRPEHVMSMRIGLPAGQYAGERTAQFYQTLLERMRAQGGVTSAGAVADLPIADGNSEWSILIDGAPMASVANSPAAMPEQITPGYFRTIGIRMVRGREFTDIDRVDAPLVVVVNEAMEKKLWPGRSAIGGTIKMLNETSPWATVIGVVKNVRHNGYIADAPPAMYFPHAQSGKSAYYVPNDMNVVVKTVGDPLPMTSRFRSLVHALEPAATISRVQSMDQIVAASIAGRRFSTQALAAFALVALLLAAIGIYGVVSYGVTQRTFEIGLRVALGAQRGQILGLVVGEGTRLAAVGLVLGVTGSFAATRFMRALFVDVSPGDPATLAAVVALLALVAFLASWLPARRATGVDPLQALRSD